MVAEVRYILDKEFADYVRVMFWAAGRAVDDAFIEQRRRCTDINGSLAAFDDGKMVATIGIRYLSLRLPGGCFVPCAALGQGGVLPGYQGQGLMRKLMTHTLAEVRAKGYAIAAWTTSEWPLYERYGGGPATYAASYEIDVHKAALRPDIEVKGTCELVSAEAALTLLPELHLASAESGGTLVARDQQYWSVMIERLTLGMSLDFLDGAGGHPAPIFCLFRDSLGVPKGLAIYRVYPVWSRGLSKTKLDLLFLIGVTGDAIHGLYRQLLSLPLIEVICAQHRPIDDVLTYLLLDGRRMQHLGRIDHIWLRILDVEQAFRARSSAQLSTPLTLAISDSHFGQTSRRYTFTPQRGGRLEVHETDTYPDAEIDIGVISSLFLGGTPVGPFVNAGRIRLNTADGLHRLVSLFSEPVSPFVDTEF